MCSSWSKRYSPSFKVTFPGKTLISLLTNKNLITVDSKRTVQKLIRLSQMFEPEHKKKTPSNADANFESTRFFFPKKDLTKLSDDLRHLSNRFRLPLQTRLFSNTVSSNNGVFKGKVFEQNETLQPVGKVIKKILIRNIITLNKTQQ